MELRPSEPSTAPLVSSWATTRQEVRAWCSAGEAPVAPEVVVGWGAAEQAEWNAGQPVPYAWRTFTGAGPRPGVPAC